MTFRKPSLFESWAELGSWLAVASLLAAGCALIIAREPMPGPIVGGAVLVGLLWVLARKFGPRIADLRDHAYDTTQGVGVVYRDHAPNVPRPIVEASLEHAIEAHGHREALDGYGLLILAGRLYAGPQRCHGVTDAGWMQVTWDGGVTEQQMGGLITHEAAHALLLAAGVPVEKHHEIMARAGTL